MPRAIKHFLKSLTKTKAILICPYWHSASFWPLLLKKKERDKIENYRSVSIINYLSKIYKKFLLESFKLFIDTFLEYIAAYREH